MAEKDTKEQTTLDKYFGGSGPPTVPTPAAKKKCPYSGIKIYSDDEIRKSDSGLDRKFKQFWNKRIIEVSTDESCKALLPTKAAIKGAVYTDWTMEKTTLLEIEADEIKLTAAKLCPKKKNDAKLTKMAKNVSEMKKKHEKLMSEVRMDPEL